MSVRDARFADIPGIVALLQDGFLRTHYAGTGKGAVDIAEAKRLITTAIARHGGQNGGSCWVQVAERYGEITGLILGTLVRVYSIGDKLMCTDLFWLASASVDPMDPSRLMKGMIGWAASCPDVIETTCATTAIINIEPERAGVILEHMGMSKYGTLYRQEYDK